MVGVDAERLPGFDGCSKFIGSDVRSVVCEIGNVRKWLAGGGERVSASREKNFWSIFCRFRVVSSVGMVLRAITRFWWSLNRWPEWCPECSGVLRSGMEWLAGGGERVSASREKNFWVDFLSLSGSFLRYGFFIIFRRFRGPWSFLVFWIFNEKKNWTWKFFRKFWSGGPFVIGLFREGNAPRGGWVTLGYTRTLALSILAGHRSILITTSGFWIFAFASFSKVFSDFEFFCQIFFSCTCF